MSRTADEVGYPNIWWVLGLALFLRSLLPISGYLYTRDATIFGTPDTASYTIPAHELIVSRRFFSDGSPDAAVWNTPVVPAPDTVRTPGYPLFLTVGMRLGRLAIVTIALQILLSCFTVYMVYATASLLFDSEWTALIGATLYAVEPLSILFSSLLSTETLFTATIMLAVYYLVKYLRQQLLRDLLVSGGALAASVYIRPAGYFLPIIIIAGLVALALGARPPTKRRLIVNLSLFVMIFYGLVGLWQVRNKIATGYSGFSSVFSEDMYCCSAASVLAAQQHLSYTRMQDRLGCYNLNAYFQQHPEQESWPVAERFSYMNRTAVRILVSNPLTYARIYFAGVVRATFDPASTEFLRFFDLYPKDGGLLDIAVDQGVGKTLKALALNPLLAWSTLGLVALQLIYLSCALLAVARLPRLDPAILLGLFIIGYYFAIPGGAAAWGRFRHPAMPLVSAFAACGLMSLRRRSSELGSGDE